MEKRDKHPLSLLILPSILGILLTEYFHFNNDLILGLGIFSFLLIAGLFLLQVRFNKSNFGLTQSILIGITAFSIYSAQTHFTRIAGLTIPANSIYQIVELEKSTTKFQTYSVNYLRKSNHESDQKVLMRYRSKNPIFFSGDVLFINPMPNRFKSPIANNEFNFKRYYESQGLSGQFFLDSSNCFLIERRPTSSSFLTKASKHLLSTIDSTALHPNAKAVLYALLLGDRSKMESEQRSRFSKLGVIHVLAVSGLHVGLFFLLIGFVLRFMGLRPTLLSSCLQLIVCWFYAFLTGMSASVNRAVLMISSHSVSRILNREHQTTNTISFVFLLMLIWRPRSIHDLGFQLSFLALLGIVLLAPTITCLLSFRKKWAGKIWQLLSVSLAAHLLTFPLILFHFKQHSNVFLISNLVLVPLFIFYLYYGLVVLILFEIFPSTEKILSKLGNLLYSLISYLSDLLSNIPFYCFEDIEFNITGLLLTYSCIVLLMISFSRRNKYLLFMSTVSILVLTLHQ